MLADLLPFEHQSCLHRCASRSNYARIGMLDHQKKDDQPKMTTTAWRRFESKASHLWLESCLFGKTAGIRCKAWAIAERERTRRCAVTDADRIQRLVFPGKETNRQILMMIPAGSEWLEFECNLNSACKCRKLQKLCRMVRSFSESSLSELPSTKHKDACQLCSQRFVNVNGTRLSTAVKRNGAIVTQHIASTRTA